jgi:hypothetical protein
MQTLGAPNLSPTRGAPATTILFSNKNVREGRACLNDHFCWSAIASAASLAAGRVCSYVAVSAERAQRYTRSQLLLGKLR